MQSTDAISLIEVVLRDLIREIVGDAWQSDDKLNVGRIRGSRDGELASRQGVSVSNDLLDFTDFSHLHGIISRRWPLFEPALGEQAEFDVFMKLLKGLRNPSMHSRPLVPHEEALVVGVAGLMTNRVTTYRSVQGPDMKYYPAITRVVDSFGNELTSQAETGLDLLPGQTVSFRCTGTDPQKRSLIWELRTQTRGNSMVQMDGRRGDEVELTWNVHEQEVRHHATIEIKMYSDGEYHRYGEYDAVLTAHYNVLPPH